MQHGCELGPRAPGPESSPPWPPCPALQKGGSLCPHRNSWVCKETARRSGGGPEEGYTAAGPGSSSGLISGARYLPQGSDSGGISHNPFPSDAASAHSKVLFPLPGLPFPSSLLPLPTGSPLSLLQHLFPTRCETHIYPATLQATVVTGSSHGDGTGIPSPSRGPRWIPQPSVS